MRSEGRRRVACSLHLPLTPAYHGTGGFVTCSANAETVSLGVVRAGVVRRVSVLACLPERQGPEEGATVAGLLDVVVVGAGAAGIAAGRRLAEAGRSSSSRGAAAARRAGPHRADRRAAARPRLRLAALGRAQPARGARRRRGAGGRPDRAAWGGQLDGLGAPEAIRAGAREAYEAFGLRLRRDPPASDRASDAMPADDPWRPYVDALSGFMNGVGTEGLSVQDFLAYDDAASGTNWRLPGGYGAFVAGPRRGPAGPASAPASPRSRRAAGSGSRPRRAPSRRGRRSSRCRPRCSRAAPSASTPPPTTISMPRRGLPLGLADKVFLAIDDPGAVPARESTSLGRFDSARTASHYLRPLRPPGRRVLSRRPPRPRARGGGRGGRGRLRPRRARRAPRRALRRRPRPLAVTAWGREPTILGSYSHAPARRRRRPRRPRRTGQPAPRLRRRGLLAARLLDRPRRLGERRRRGGFRRGGTRMSFFESLLLLLAVAILLLQVTRRLRIPYPTMLAAAGVALGLVPGAPQIALDPADRAGAVHRAGAGRRGLRLPASAARQPLAAALRARGHGGGGQRRRRRRARRRPRRPALLRRARARGDRRAARRRGRDGDPRRRQHARPRGLDPQGREPAQRCLGAAALRRGDGGPPPRGRDRRASPCGFAIAVPAGCCSASCSRSPCAASSCRASRGTLGGNLLEFVTAFGVWIIAERLELSAVLCLVAFAMTIARDAGLTTRARTRIHSFAVWDTAVFLLNVLAFLLMGLQARAIVAGMTPGPPARGRRSSRSS